MFIICIFIAKTQVGIHTDTFDFYVTPCYDVNWVQKRSTLIVLILLCRKTLNREFLIHGSLLIFYEENFYDLMRSKFSLYYIYSIMDY